MNIFSILSSSRLVHESWLGTRHNGSNSRVFFVIINTYIQFLRDQNQPKIQQPEVFNSSVEMVTPRSRVQTKPTRFSSKKNVKKRIGAIIRRSDRLRNVTPPAQNREIEPVVEEINLCESEKEDDPHVEETPPESMLPEESLEEKTDYPAGGLKSKAAKRHFQSDSSSADLKYKRLYFDSQKKNEALTKENYELSKNLAVAMGKIEGLAESSRVCSGLLGKLQDVLLISNLGKATETAMNLSSQAVLCRCSSPSGVGDPKVAVKKKAKGVGDPKVAVKKKAKGVGDLKVAVKKKAKGKNN